MLQFLQQHYAALLLTSAGLFSILATALPDDLRDFDIKTYLPKVLKAISLSVPTKHPPPG